VTDSTRALVDEKWDGICDRYLSSGLQDMQVEEKWFFLIYDMLGQVGNGGLESYFDNSTGHLAAQTADALDLLGANRSAEVFRRAMAYFPNAIVPTDWDERRAVIDQLDDAAFEHWRESSNVIYEEQDLLILRLSELPLPTD
jgi:hypothetical protein